MFKNVSFLILAFIFCIVLATILFMKKEQPKPPPDIEVIDISRYTVNSIVPETRPDGSKGYRAIMTSPRGVEHSVLINPPIIVCDPPILVAKEPQ